MDGQLGGRGFASTMGISAGLHAQPWKSDGMVTGGDLRRLHQHTELGEEEQGSVRQPVQASYPDLIEQLDLPVEGAIDVLHIEERIIPDLDEQVLGKVADVVFAEVPFAQDPAGDDHLGVLVAALTEVLAQVLTVPQPLDII